MYQRLSNIITSNNTWVFISIIITFVFMWVMTFVDFRFTMIYLNERKWRLFASTLFYVFIVFSPVLLFSIFRKGLVSENNKLWSHTIWIIVFLLYPSSLALFSYDFLPVSINKEIIVTLGFVLTIAEVFTNPYSQIEIKTDWRRFYRSISIQWLPVIIYFSLSIYMAFMYVSYNNPKSSFGKLLFGTMTFMGIHYLFYRVHYYLLIEKIYKSKGIIYYCFALLGLIVVFALPLILTVAYVPGMSHFSSLKLGEHWVGADPPTYFYSVYLGSVMGTMIMTIPLTILVQWVSQTRKIETLQKEKSEAELSLLKQQINPHFFFNTLNNVYALSLDKNSKAPDAILQLSDLMRFVIYEGTNDYVPLRHEVEYLQDYFELQKMRLHEGHDIRLDINIENPEIDIAPLLFIILLENAFKHGIENKEEDGFILASIKESQGVIRFECRNTYDNLNNTAGLGLTNLKKRLELVYPDKHELDIIEESMYFTATLEIDTRKS